MKIIYLEDFEKIVDKTAEAVKKALSKRIDVMKGATSSADGTTGLVPAPVAGQEHSLLMGSGAWSSVPVGGRNLVLDSEAEQIRTHQNTNLIMGHAWSLSDYGKQLIDRSELNTPFVISLDMKVEAPNLDADTAAKEYIRVLLDVRDTTGSIMLRQTSNYQNLNQTEYQRYYYYTYRVGTGLSYNVRSVLACSIATPVKVYIKNIKVELGDIPTDYTPAPEDMISASTYSDIIAHDAAIQLSDINAKDDINDLSVEMARNLILGSIPKTYRMKEDSHGRYHWGMISNDVEELLDKIGLTDMDFGGFIKSPKTKIVTKPIMVYEDEEGNPLEEPIEQVIEEAVDDGYTYALRYAEYIAPMIKVMQEQEKRISELERLCNK